MSLAACSSPAASRIRLCFVQRTIGTNKYVDALEEHMFFGLVVAAASPLPFEAFRLVACIRSYSWVRYGAATLIGRGARFYALASFGVAIDSLGLVTWIIGGMLVLFALSLGQSILKIRADAR